MRRWIMGALTGMAAGMGFTLAFGLLPRARAADEVPPMRMITADTDLSRIETIHVTHDEKPQLVPCKLPPKYHEEKCLKVLKGPFVLTDVTGYLHCPSLQFVRGAKWADAPGRDTPRWRVVLDVGYVRLHGARYSIRSDETLFITDPAVADLQTVTVSGFHPY